MLKPPNIILLSRTWIRLHVRWHTLKSFRLVMHRGELCCLPSGWLILILPLQLYLIPTRSILSFLTMWISYSMCSVWITRSTVEYLMRAMWPPWCLRLLEGNWLTRFVEIHDHSDLFRWKFISTTWNYSLCPSPVVREDRVNWGWGGWCTPSIQTFTRTELDLCYERDNVFCFFM